MSMSKFEAYDRKLQSVAMQLLPFHLKESTLEGVLGTLGGERGRGVKLKALGTRSGLYPTGLTSYCCLYPVWGYKRKEGREVSFLVFAFFGRHGETGLSMVVVGGGDSLLLS